MLGEVGVAEGMTVADLGCGSHGFFVFQASKMIGDKGVVFAVDIQKSVLEAIDSKIRLDNVSNVKTVRANLEIVGTARTAIPDSSLDRDFLIVEWKKTAAPLGPSVDRRVLQEVARQCAEAAGLILEKNFDAGLYHYGMVFVKK